MTSEIQGLRQKNENLMKGKVAVFPQPWQLTAFCRAAVQGLGNSTGES